MNSTEGAVYDPETIKLLRAVLDEAWNSLVTEQQAQTSKCLLAERILGLAAKGERDPMRLRIAALTGLSPRWDQSFNFAKPTDRASLHKGRALAQ
jgi:hypothetical protein